MSHELKIILNKFISILYTRQYSNYLVVAVLSIFISGFYFTFTSNDLVVGFLSDDAVYLLQAELYSPWHSEELPVLDFIREESRFPPLYPLLLGFMGADTSNPVLASNITICFLILSIFISGYWIWCENKLFVSAILIPILLAFLPSTLVLAQGLWSEFLFMCLIYSAFACHTDDLSSDRHWLIQALLIGLASLTRSIGITITAAYILLLLIRRPRNYLIFICISLIPFMLWSLIRNMVMGYPSYFDDLITLFDDGSFISLYETVFNQLMILANSWIWLFSIVEPDFSYKYLINFISLFLCIFCLIGFYVRIKQLKLDALCVPFYLCAVLIWPYNSLYFVSRFLYPLLPLLLFYMWIGIQHFDCNAKTHNFILALWLLSISIIAYPSSKQFITRGFTNTETELIPYRRSRSWLLAPTNTAAREIATIQKKIIETLPDVSEYIPLQECIYAHQAPIVMLYTHRISGVFPSSNNFDKKIKGDDNQCRFYLAMPVTDMEKKYPVYYPLQFILKNPNFEITTVPPDPGNQDEASIYLIKRITS